MGELPYCAHATLTRFSAKQDSSYTMSIAVTNTTSACRQFAGVSLLCLLLLSGVSAGAQSAHQAAQEEADAASPPDMLHHINEARSSAQTCGDEAFDAASPLKWSDDLAEAARMHNEDMTTNVFRGHEGSDGSTPHERIERITPAFVAAGETISYFTESDARAVTRWLESPGHCRVLMKPDLTHVGTHSTRGPRFDAPEQEGAYRTAVFGAMRPGLRPLSRDARTLLREQDITVYGRGTRGRVRALRNSLQHAEIPFTYRDIEAETTHRQAMRQVLQAGPKGTQVTLPVVHIGEYVFTGMATAHALARAVRAQSNEKIQRR